jgi:hypothetical protein
MRNINKPKTMKPVFLAIAPLFGVLLFNACSIITKTGEPSENFSVSNEYWKARRDLAREKRNGPTGISPKGLEVPETIRADGAPGQKAKLREMQIAGFQIPMDFTDLAKKRNKGKLVEIPMANENWVLEVGGSTTRNEFTSFNFSDHSESPKLIPGSPDHNTLSELAADFSGMKYDMNDPDQRRRMKMRLLSMINPAAKSVLEQIAASYNAKFRRPLIIISMTRSIEYQIGLNRFNPQSFKVRGADSFPPHTSGCAFDIARKHMTADEQNFLMEMLEEKEKSGDLDAMIEKETATLHVFVYEDGSPPKMD